ncbi:MAG: VWA domain-containing protein [Treponema sp.]|nr:VWA domain-containing protein [Treponema sp.]
MIEFENPRAFFLLAFIPLLFFLRRIRIFTPITFPLTLSDWNGKSFSWPHRMRRLISVTVRILCTAGFTLAVTAYANPVVHMHEKVYTSRGADILFVVDTSPSMASRDMAGDSRLDAAKKAIETLLQDHGGASIGLVQMGREAAVVVPPTMDREIFMRRLGSLTVGELGDGSAIGTGLSCAAFHLKSSPAPKKSIILITDGENNAGSIHPVTAARFLAQKGISLYVLGIGTKGSVPLEYTDPRTGRMYSGYLESNYDSAQLLKLASSADGVFYEADSLTSLQQAMSSISKNEGVAQTYHIKSTDKFYYRNLILVAAICVMAAWILCRLLLQEIL